jgi:myo-inositol 2-dehydrogenase/D-chiro-inositol 1-dehydrogenase
MAVHHFDLWRYILGHEVEEISASTRSGIWEDESATVTARLSGGALASAIFGERTSQNNAIEIYGRTGSMSVSFYRCDGLEVSTTSDIPGNVRARLMGVAQFLRELPRAISILQRGGEWRQSYIEEWRHFVSAVQTGQPVECGLEDGRRALTIALAAMESAVTGKAITIPNG